MVVQTAIFHVWEESEGDQGKNENVLDEEVLWTGEGHHDDASSDVAFYEYGMMRVGEQGVANVVCPHVHEHGVELIS